MQTLAISAIFLLPSWKPKAGIQSKSSVQSTQLIRLDTSLRWHDDNNS
jgi:hypothetical protein